MECNREAATRAKEISEQKFEGKDIVAAKKFALKAQNLNPELEGISQMVATFEVYLASENKISGLTDWYAVLGINAMADDDTVRKQYRKLALMLHPDKNKSVGAEGAFKLLSEAWSVLSDKNRRFKYDLKRNAKGFHQNVQKHREYSVPNSNGFCNFTKTTSNTINQKTTRPTVPTSVPSAPCPPKINTFWTVCNHCRMQFEYLRIYLNHSLLCPNCQRPFLAVEMWTPANVPNSSAAFSFPEQQRLQNENKNAYVQGSSTANGLNAGNAGYTQGASIDSFKKSNFLWSEYYRATGFTSASASASSATQTANATHHTHEKVVREREEVQAATKTEGDIQRMNSASKRALKNCSVGNSSAASNSNVLDREHCVSMTNRPLKKRKCLDDGGAWTGIEKCGERGAKGLPTIRKTNSIAGPSERERADDVARTRNILMEKSRKMILMKLAEWNDAIAAAKASVKEKEAARRVNNSVKEKAAAKPISNAVKKKVVANADASENNMFDELSIEPTLMSMDVPDPDFHDFDMDRMEKSFDANQVWAAYDNDDGMPRFYALIQRVISLKPFKMRFSWLNSKTNSELGPIKWVASGFTKICGEFRVGRHEVTDTVNVFSHQVRWEKGVRGALKIIPRAGDVWALYRNWSPDWNETTIDDVVHKYDMVEVLDDYSEENGVSIAPLVKVAGFKTVFRRHTNPAQVRRIPREEMFRFSHQVPSCLLTGEEAANAPKGCRELDPAATPLELLQVLAETAEEKAPDATAPSMQECKEKNSAETAEKMQMQEAKKEKDATTEKRQQEIKHYVRKRRERGEVGKENMDSGKQMNEKKQRTC